MYIDTHMHIIVLQSSSFIIRIIRFLYHRRSGSALMASSSSAAKAAEEASAASTCSDAPEVISADRNHTHHHRHHRQEIDDRDEADSHANISGDDAAEGPGCSAETCSGKRKFQLSESVHNEKEKMLKISKAKEDFKCCICLSIWHDVVSVAPCLHNFCNGCFSEFLKKKRDSKCKCPQCREAVIFVRRNHTLCSMLEDFLKEYPSLKRSAEEIAQLDQLAIVGNKFMNVGEPGNDSSTDDDSHDEDEQHHYGWCPQCPRPNSLEDGYHCSPETVHLTCYACNTLMPERTDIDIPQSCAGCGRIFCDLYWRTQNIFRSHGEPVSCVSSGVLEKLVERRITDLPHGSFRGNTYEQDVTKRYLQEQRLEIQDVLHEWLGKMDRGEIDKPNLPRSQATSITAESCLCNQCADSVIEHLIYKFRLSLPKHELPPDAAGREDCWYGFQCRTQLHKASHAHKYNHACEPSARARRT